MWVDSVEICVEKPSSGHTVTNPAWGRKDVWAPVYVAAPLCELFDGSCDLAFRPFSKILESPVPPDTVQLLESYENVTLLLLGSPCAKTSPQLHLHPSLRSHTCQDFVLHTFKVLLIDEPDPSFLAGRDNAALDVSKNLVVRETQQLGCFPNCEHLHRFDLLPLTGCSFHYIIYDLDSNSVVSWDFI